MGHPNASALFNFKGYLYESLKTNFHLRIYNKYLFKRNTGKLWILDGTLVTIRLSVIRYLPDTNFHDQRH